MSAEDECDDGREQEGGAPRSDHARADDAQAGDSRAGYPRADDAQAEDVNADVGDADASGPAAAGRSSIWEHERIADDRRVSDDQWEAVVAEIGADRGFVPEMSADEVRERLAEDDDWHPPEPERIGWRSAPPLFVLAVVGVLGGVGTLLVATVFFRPISGMLVLVLLAIILLSGLLLFLNLSDERRSDGTGAQV